MLDSGMPGLGIDLAQAAGASGKPRLQFSIPCLQVDEEKGPPSFMYVFYEIPLPEIPFTFPDKEGFFIANGWCNGVGDYTQRLKILNPDRSVAADTQDQPFKLKSKEEPFMAVNYLQGMHFAKAGTYTIQVYLKNELVLEYPLPVRKAAGSAPKK